MPIYAYRCAQCGFDQDVLQKISDPKLTICPSCGAAAFEKQVTAAGFQLKGSGWYVTDFKNSGAAPAPAKAVKADGAESNSAGSPDGAPAPASSGDAKSSESASAPSKGQDAKAAPSAAPAPAPSSAAAAPSKPSTPPGSST